MKSQEYWRKRFIELENASNSYGVNAYRRIEEAFRLAERDIQREIEAWYGRYATNNGISIAEAKKQLTAKELQELRWDVEEYIKRGHENALNGRWMKELENASARVHISRLEALKLRVQQAAETAFGNELDELDAMARKVFTEDYYHSIFEMQKGFNMGWEIGQIDERKLETMISKPWAADGKHFSERIWQQRTQLVNVLHQELTRTVLLGKAPRQAIETISRQFKTTRGQAARLVMTEQAYFHSAAQKEAFKELDVEEFEIVATLDDSTSDICQEMDGKHFPMSQYEAGVTAPPFHVYCRSVTAPYFEDNFTGERAARDVETGETYYVPDSMTYKDWASEYISDEIDVKRVKNNIKNKADILTRKRPPKPLSDVISDNPSIESTIDNAPEPFKTILKSKSQDIKFAKTNCIGTERYDPKYGIFVNHDKDFNNSRGRWSTLFHEVGHNIDVMVGKLSNNSSFVNILRTDFEVFTKGVSLNYNINIDESYKKMSQWLKSVSDEESHIISDLFDALSNGKCKGRFSHRKDYWKSDEIIASEAFAHFFSASTLDNKVKLGTIKQVFPNAYAEFMKLVGGIK